jgi:photosystem II stability/assembly factor-like uncharacterized protein
MTIETIAATLIIGSYAAVAVSLLATTIAVDWPKHGQHGWIISAAGFVALVLACAAWPIILGVEMGKDE